MANGLCCARMRLLTLPERTTDDLKTAVYQNKCLYVPAAFTLATVTFMDL